MSELPYEFPVRTLPGNLWPPLPGRMNAVWSAYLELCRTEHYSATHLQALQLIQLGALLEHARAHVPYYRSTLPQAPTRLTSVEEFQAFPLLSRSTYQTRFEEFVASELPSGTQRVGALFTAGSSGVAVTVHQTNMVQLWWQASSLRDLRWSGVDVRSTLAAIRYYSGSDQQKAALAHGVTLPHWNHQLKELMQTGPSHALDIHQDPGRQLEWLQEKQPDYLISYPSNLAALARLALDRGVSFPTIRAVLCVSEALTDDLKNVIETAFSAPTKNTYSCMEAGYLASPCPLGRGLHVHSENVLFEILDDDGRPCPPGETGNVTITTLRNFATPLLRYQIMDRASWAKEPCGCGIGLPLIEPPWGKRHPPFVLPSGKRKNSMGLAVGMRKIGAMLQFKISQETRAHVAVRVLPAAQWSDAHAQGVRELVTEFFEAPIECSITLMTSLERSEAGKAGHLECRVADDLK